MTQQDREEMKSLIRETLAEFLRPDMPIAVPTYNRDARGLAPFAIRAAMAMEELDRKSRKKAAQRMDDRRV